MLTVAIAGAYVLLILISLFLDPKRRGGTQGYFIYKALLFSTLKMLIVIGLVVVFAILGRKELAQVLGLSGFIMNWQGLGFGVLAAVGFVAIYVFWKVIASRFKTERGETANSGSRLVESLPRHWLPLIGTFGVISLEAGLLEEIFFRGIMQSHAAGYVMQPLAVLICGFLFGIAHFYQSISGIAGTSALGIWLGVMYAVTGNLVVPVIGHFLGDFACMMLGARQIIGRNAASDRDQRGY
ncbi:CPBP family intramembrane metalloprotease [candidate division WOR-3 bacterium]|nr:CPBP family intramembrane metalloprotease [candidate division WOR-3 bacterium]